jgi:transposase InsO family protein
LYLVAIIDWASRRVQSWRLSNTLCVKALSAALARFGKPGIFNTDQGAQFTSAEFTKVLLDHGIEISMDGRGRRHDNIFVERLWNGRCRDRTGSRVDGRHVMFKVLVLQRLYTLSDDQTEYQLKDRLPFMRFVGLAPHDAVPDAKTI